MAIFLGKLVRLTGLEPTRRIDTSTSSWPVYQFQHSRKFAPPKKDCLIIISVQAPNVNHDSAFFEKIFPAHFGPGKVSKLIKDLSDGVGDDKVRSQVPGHR